jgi:crotonobetainyl-CoA:carnitine CoA-transferase CaiB-like acyl-CoA transferase
MTPATPPDGGPGERPGPPHELRIIDLTTAWAGPMATRIVAYLGADVIHIEGPDRPDSWRGPIKGGDVRRYPDLDYGQKPWNRCTMFNTQNTDKRTISLDLKLSAGVQILQRLVAGADALITNFSPGTLRKFGVAAADCLAANPRLVVLEMPAYGLTGPMAGNIALGPTMEAACGMASLIGYGDGQPVVTGPAYMDPIGALNGAAALLTAIAWARATGRGQHVELAQCEAAMHWVGEEILAACEGQDTSPVGNTVSYAEPHDAYRCAGDDQWVAISVLDDRDWQRVCQLAGRPDLCEPGTALRTIVGRRRHRAEVRTALEVWTRPQSKWDVASALQAAGVVAAPVCDGADMAQRPDLTTAGFFIDLESADGLASRYQGLSFQFSRTAAQVRRHAPVFGQDNRAVLHELLGLSASECDALRQARVLTDEPRGTEAALPPSAGGRAEPQHQAS